MEMLEPGRVAEEFPEVAAEGRAALLCRATGQVRVAELVQALRAACVAAGVRIREGVAVNGLPVEGERNRIVGAQTDAELLRADNVLVTAGTWSGLVAPEVADIAPVRPAKGQGIALRMPEGLRMERIIKSETIYLIPWHDGMATEVLVGSTTEPEAGFNEGVTEKARKLLVAGAVGLVPGLKGAEVLRQWAGLRPENPARRHPPIMGVHPEVGNLFVCTGHFKTGIGLSARVGRLMAGVVAEGTASAELAPFAPV